MQHAPVSAANPLHDILCHLLCSPTEHFHRHGCLNAGGGIAASKNRFSSPYQETNIAPFLQLMQQDMPRRTERKTIYVIVKNSRLARQEPIETHQRFHVAVSAWPFHQYNDSRVTVKYQIVRRRLLQTHASPRIDIDNNNFIITIILVIECCALFAFANNLSHHGREV